MNATKFFGVKKAMKVLGFISEIRRFEKQPIWVFIRPFELTLLVHNSQTHISKDYAWDFSRNDMRLSENRYPKITWFWGMRRSFSPLKRPKIRWELLHSGRHPFHPWWLVSPQSGFFFAKSTVAWTNPSNRSQEPNWSIMVYLFSLLTAHDSLWMPVESSFSLL